MQEDSLQRGAHAVARAKIPSLRALRSIHVQLCPVLLREILLHAPVDQKTEHAVATHGGQLYVLRVIHPLHNGAAEDIPRQEVHSSAAEICRAVRRIPFPVKIHFPAQGKGISRLVREKCDFIAELPMPGGFESLNAGVAAAVAMYEIVRQRG